MHAFGPYLRLECLHELVLIGTIELHLSLAEVCLGQFVMDEEVTDADFLPIRKSVYLGQDASVFIEVPRLYLHYFALNHPLQDLLHFLPKFLRLSLSAFRGVDSSEPEDEASGGSIKVYHCLDRVSVSHLAYLRQECLVVERKLGCIFYFQQGIVLFRSNRLQMGQGDALREEATRGSIDHFLLIEQDCCSLLALFLLLVVGRGSCIQSDPPSS